MRPAHPPKILVYNNYLNLLLVLLITISFRSLNETYELSDDEEIDIVSSEVKTEVKRQPPAAGRLEALPVESEQDRLRFLFVERKCQDIGLELRNEDVGSGYSYR